MSINYAPMKAELVNGIDFSSVKVAWSISRPNDTQPDLTKILKMDVPVNEFCQVVFCIYAPIAVRDFFCGFRDHVLWARSSRVDDLSNWVLWDKIEGNVSLHASLLKDEMDKRRAANSEHQDAFRIGLPLCYMTNFTVSLSFRSLIKLLLSLRNERDPALQELYKAFLEALGKHGFTEQILTTFPYEPFGLNASLTTFSEQESKNFSWFILVREKMSYALRSQLIRHRQIIFQDCFLLINLRLLNRLSFSTSDEYDVRFGMTREFAYQLLRKRSCWIADRALWRNVIRSVSEALGIEGDDGFGRDKLPCHDGQCHFSRDQALRLEGKDPAPPCPIERSLTGNKLTTEQAKDALEYAKSRPLYNFWRKEIDNAV